MARGFVPWLLVLLGLIGATGIVEGLYYWYHHRGPRIVEYWYMDYIGKYDVVLGPMFSYIANITTKPLNDTEKQWLIHMREEEKLARDVYLTLYERWGLPIFKNIARSEQNHMDAIKVLLDKYNLTDPVEETGDEIGKFVDPKLQELYNQLVEEGSKSIVDALKVGATIEDLDIKDLEEAISQTDNEDIKLVYENLMRGSRNHLRAFESMLRQYGSSYQCQFISQEECNEIISTSWERGMVNHMGHPMGMGIGRRWR
jgi:hypothetical protein